MKTSQKQQELALSGWRGGTFGMRVDAQSRSRALLPLKGKLPQVHFVLPGYGVQPICRLSRTFLTTCLEFRSAEIGKWMKARGDAPWPLGRPPQYRAKLVHAEADTAEIRVFG